MGREEGGFQAFLKEPPLVTDVCHEIIHLRLCDGLKCRCSISCQAKWVSSSCQANILSPYITDICFLEVLCFLEVDMNDLQTGAD